MSESSTADLDAENQKKIAVVRTLLERVIAKGEQHLIPELCEDPAMISRGTEKIAMMRAAFPDLAFDVDRYEVHGEFVIAYFQASGTHLGELMGRPATGKKVVFEGSNIYRIRNGKIREGWGHLNTQDALKSILG